MSDPKEYYPCTCGCSDFRYRKLTNNHKLECVGCGKLTIPESEMDYSHTKYNHVTYSCGTVYDPETDIVFDAEHLQKLLRTFFGRATALHRSMETINK